MSDYFIRKAGTYTCKISDARREKHKNASEDQYIQFVLSDESGKIVFQNFLMTEKAMVALRSFCRACGLTRAQALAPRRKDFIDARAEVDIDINENGYPYVTKWRKATILLEDEIMEEEPEEDNFLI